MTTTAVILSAGRGKRLSPLTDTRPKCLVEVGGRAILDWQLRALHANGIRDIAIVTGFETGQVERAVEAMGLPVPPRIVFNPFHGVADNLGSCWMARDHIGADTVLLNGDTLFEDAVLARLLAEARPGITVTADAKPHYDADDMKIRVEDGRLAAIGKTLTGRIDGESIGMLRFLGEGGARFVAAMRRALERPEALSLWYLSVVDALARDGAVGVVRLAGERWCEVDFPTDLMLAEATVARFRAARAGGLPSAACAS